MREKPLRIRILVIFRIIILICALLLVFSYFLVPHKIKAIVVWSDDFNDGDYTGGPQGWSVYSGSFSAASNSLNSTGPGIGLIYCNSTVSTGTWSFDVYPAHTTDVFSIAFIRDDSWFGSTRYAYEIVVDWFHQRSSIRKWDNYVPVEIASYYHSGGISGWLHIDVTRDLSGQIYVYFNGALGMDVVDTTVTVSDYFTFTTGRDTILDNIVVRDDVVVTPDPANLQFVENSVSVTCPQGFNVSVDFSVHNYGEEAGSATIVLGSLPSGITISVNPNSINDLKVNNTKWVTATVFVDSSSFPGDYVVSVELREGLSVIDTIQLNITAAAAPMNVITWLLWEGIIVGLLAGLVAAYIATRYQRRTVGKEITAILQETLQRRSPVFDPDRLVELANELKGPHESLQDASELLKTKATPERNQKVTEQLERTSGLIQDIANRGYSPYIESILLSVSMTVNALRNDWESFTKSPTDFGEPESPEYRKALRDFHGSINELRELLFEIVQTGGLPGG